MSGWHESVLDKALAHANDLTRWREAVRQQADALRRAGHPGYPSPEAACRIIADDLDRMADEGV